ncbi:hypothetical protein DL771_000226 [Monosporascus sp. 5C6A]|nr:hypothetical protein DL771_000226 [Monosporascus sp. 5C6A]
MSSSDDHPQTRFAETRFHGASVLRARRRTFARTGARAQLRQLRETGRYDAFRLRWQPAYDVDRDRWPCPRPVFWDSDVAKWLEGACYLLAAGPYDPEVDAAVRELAAMIRSAQQEDGYLNVYFTVVAPERRWTDIRDMHELYNAGHLIEAALAHSKYYKTDFLVEVVEKYVRYIRSVIGPEEGRLHAYPGHPEMELALLRLHAATGSADALELARYFVEERGNPAGQDGEHFYDWEARRRGDSPWKRPDAYPVSGEHWYNQSHAPILEQRSVEGHAVRAMYLLAGVADLLCTEKKNNNNNNKKTGGVEPHHSGSGSQGEEREKTAPAESRKSAYFKALTRLWDNMVDRKMYLTGGIGAMKQWEGFGIDYFLPQGSDEGGCYNETCASIGAVMLAERLLHLDLDARYGDIMELCLYNNVMTGMGLDGASFTYVNQLASSEAQPSRRERWFEVSCCPPNLMRLFGSLGGYLWDYGAVAAGPPGEVFVNVHLYTTAVVTFEVEGQSVSLEQRSNWPWEGTISFDLKAPSSMNTTIRLRIPGWAHGKFTLSPAPDPTAAAEGATLGANGYLVLPPAYTAAYPSFTLQIHGFEPRHLAPHPRTGQRTLALARGPLIYCAEDADNPWVLAPGGPAHFRGVAVSPASPVQEARRTLRVRPGFRARWDEAARAYREDGDAEEDGEEEGYVELRSEAWVRDMTAWEGKRAGAAPGLAVDEGDGEGWEDRKREVVFIPYYLRANRGGEGHMRVGLLRK